MNEIRDADPAHDSTVFVTWASVSAFNIGDQSSFEMMVNIITELEIKLQIVWNKCNTLSEHAGKILLNKVKARTLDGFYWEIAQALDDGKSVLSTTASSRANMLFAEMVSTSIIDGELARLDSKVQMCEKYIEYRKNLADRKYRRAIEILLFLAAVSQLMPVLFQLPVEFLKQKQLLSAVFIVFFVIAGVLAIGRRRD